MSKTITTFDGVQIAIDKQEARISHRSIADTLGVEQRAIMQLINSYERDLAEFGKVTFQMLPLPSGQRERIAYLNEDQCYLVLTYSRNTPKARLAKINLVKAFYWRCKIAPNNAPPPF